MNDQLLEIVLRDWKRPPSPTRPLTCCLRAGSARGEYGLVTGLADADLYCRGAKTLLACWVPPGFARQAGRDAFHVLIAAPDGAGAAAAMAFDWDGDCGIYNVATLEHARRRGLGTALTALAARDALARGCHTASLQSTPMAEAVYAALGFRDLGQILEFVPPGLAE
jgi:GNAT superfamily N-acetyltransferase